MGHYRVICVFLNPGTGQHDHPFVKLIGTGESPHSPPNMWTLEQVLNAIRRGDQFYTQNQVTKKIARVERFFCGKCGKNWLRTAKDSNLVELLEFLPECPRTIAGDNRI